MNEKKEEEDIVITNEILIQSPAAALFSVWRQFQNLPQILHYLESVTILDQTHSLWTTHIGEENELITWKIEITEELPATTLQWHSIESPYTLHEGSITFSPKKDNQTELHLELRFYFPKLQDSKPFMLGKNFAALINEDLRRFKQAIEAQEFPEQPPQDTSSEQLQNISKKLFYTEKRKNDSRKNEKHRPEQ
jgi:uncharacterized membrane protein